MNAPSIAVLPFANMSREADDEYFSDGLAEEILNLLAKIPDLKVTARTSSFAFRGKEEDIRGIASALNVGTILEGSVRRAGNRIRVTAQLINAADGFHIWSERYDREMTDVFAVQDEISASIASAMKVTLIGKSTAARVHEPQMDAYEAFLKGRHHYYKFSPEAFVNAGECFKQACELDPEWADPHSALGDLYFSQAFFGWRPLQEAMRAARAAAAKALDIHPNQPMAHAVLGGIAGLHDYDWKEAGKQFKAAIRSAASENVYLFHAMFHLLPQGRFVEASEVMAKAIELDPLNGMWRSRQAWMLVCGERYEEAIAEARKGLELNDQDYQAHMMISLSYCFEGRQAEALKHAREVSRLAPWDALGAGLLAGLLARAGDKERSQKVLDSMTGAITIGMVMYHLVCSEIELGIDWYQKEIEQRQPNGPMIAYAGFLEPFRLNLRWPKMARIMNLPGA